MTVRIKTPETIGPRKLKAHKKSRSGCSNCKLRSVKCDESKPACKRCTSYGVCCSYTPTSDDSLLQLPSELTTIINLTRAPAYFADTQSEVIAKFQNRTCMTVTAGGRIRLYQKEILDLARSHPYLMNSIFALTFLHDHYLSGSPSSNSASFSSEHYSKSIHSYSKALSQARNQQEESGCHISPDYQATLWATGAMLGTIVFCNVDAATPQEAWPLRAPSSSDLDWLKMNEGKRCVYLLTLGLQADPIYKPLFEIHTNTLIPRATTPPSFDRLPPELLDYFNVFGAPSDEDRIYHPSIRSLARIYATNCSIVQTILTFWTWCADMTPHFRSLLEQKEPRALLILSFWWAEIYQTTVWWFGRRSRLEGLAICLYLEQYYWEDEQLVMLAQYPRAAFETPLFPLDSKRLPN